MFFFTGLFNLVFVYRHHITFETLLSRYRAEWSIGAKDRVPDGTTILHSSRSYFYTTQGQILKCLPLPPVDIDFDVSPFHFYPYKPPTLQRPLPLSSTSLLTTNYSVHTVNFVGWDPYQPHVPPHTCTPVLVYAYIHLRKYPVMTSRYHRFTDDPTRTKEESWQSVNP